MIEWEDYIKRLLNVNCAFDSVSLSIRGEDEQFYVPPIIKASILMLDRMIASQGQYNIFVFPEKAQSSFIFALIKLIHNITEGKIEKAYNPESFLKGEKLKFQNCVVAFNRIDMHNGEPHLWVDDADCTVGAPIEMMPLFQRTNTKRRLSKDSEFSKAKKKAREQLWYLPQTNRQLAFLADYKTHMESSIFYVAPIVRTKKQLLECKFNGLNISDFLLIGQANYEGEIKNIGAGQLSGVPSIVLATDLYTVNASAENGSPIQSLIVDVSNSNIIESQLDALDGLIRMDFPFVCITDVANSFDLRPLVDRGFNLWRWDEFSITGSLYDASPISLDRKIKHCAKRRVEYITADGNEITDSVRKLYTYKAEIMDQSARMISLFNKLFSITFIALRTITPVMASERKQIQRNLSDCEIDLSKEKAFINETAYNDYKKVISNLKSIFSSMFTFPKHTLLQSHLKDNNYQSICIIIPDRMDKQSTLNYWRGWCSDQSLQTTVTVLYPSEYYSITGAPFSTTIIVGWLKKTIMKEILYSFNTESYIILVYDYECRWKNAHTAFWNRALNNGNNKTIIKKYFNTDKLDISVTRFWDQGTPVMEPEPDEFNEIELLLRKSKYHQYVTSGRQRATDETTEAIPVNFVGGFIAFYKTSHKIVTATNIIINDDEKIAMKFPSQLKVGDFVIFREAGKDVIKELADTILKNSGKQGYRELAKKWKESLTIKCMFFSHEEIYAKLKAVGCTKNFQTVHGWIVDEDIIAPQQKDDLVCIARVTEDAVLIEMIDQVFEAAREVKSAHIQVGRYLSTQLKKIVAPALQEYGDIDPLNIWEPIVLSLEDIGTVKILKVIDIGPTVIVNTTDTNRLIEEA